jgi:hypothetical protein
MEPWKWKYWCNLNNSQCFLSQLQTYYKTSLSSADTTFCKCNNNHWLFSEKYSIHFFFPVCVKTYNSATPFQFFPLKYLIICIFFLQRMLRINFLPENANLLWPPSQSIFRLFGGSFLGNEMLWIHLTDDFIMTLLSVNLSQVNIKIRNLLEYSIKLSVAK